MLGGIEALTAYPIATVSAAAFYAVLIALAFPAVRRSAQPWLSAPNVSQHHLAGFDTMRGLAAALVAMGHGWWATYPVMDATRDWLPFVRFGHKGVPIFCVLSGFLIYRAVLAVHSLEELRAYAIRRFFRIYPVYLVSVALCVVTMRYVAAETFSATQLFFSDLFMFRILDWPVFTNPVTWSLYIEAAFYVALPLVVLVVRPRRMAMFALFGIVAMLLADQPYRDYALWRYFLYGILAAELSPHLKGYALPLFVTGAGLLVLDLVGPEYDWGALLIGQKHVDGQTIGIGIACCLILACLPHLRRVGSALDVLPLRLLGLVSYSLYVIHIFFIYVNFPQLALFVKVAPAENYKSMLALPTLPDWFLPFVVFPGMLAWAVACYLLVERPGMAFGRYLARGRSRIIAQPAE